MDVVLCDGLFVFFRSLGCEVAINAEGSKYRKREREWPGQRVYERNIRSGPYRCEWTGRNRVDQLPKKPEKVWTKQHKESDWLLPAAVPVCWSLGWEEEQNVGHLSYCHKEGLLCTFWALLNKVKSNCSAIDNYKKHSYCLVLAPPNPHAWKTLIYSCAPRRGHAVLSGDFSGGFNFYKWI